jgi:DNA-binding SARP family transcriptional activator
MRAWRNHNELALGRPFQRAVLGMLAAHAGRVVSRDWLIDGIWGEDPPRSVVNSLHVYVGELRRALEPERGARSPSRFLVSGGHGYLLRIEPAQVDANAFTALLRQARDERDLEATIKAFDAAMKLWRGAAWAGIPGPFADTERARLGELYAACIEDRAEALLAVGRNAEVAAELHGVVREYPLRERLRLLMMLALYRSHRQAEAFSEYETVRKLLAEDLGVEPGQELQRLYSMMLAGDTTLDAIVPVLAGGSRAASGKVCGAPRQLPRTVRNIAGRHDELAALADLARQAAEAASTAVCVIGGTAGIGKTALALNFAHQAAGAFPDGQLYVNLRGFDPVGAPASPRQAIRGLLDALAIHPDRIPADLDAMAAFYRSELAGKSMLIVLDNARTEDQVRPMLPGTGRSLVIVTSRRKLTGLAAEGAALLTLDTLPAPAARDLLSQRMGGQRLAEDAASLDELTALCAGLPLALTVVAARAESSHGLSLADLTAELRQAGSRLDALDSGEPATSVRPALAWSYEGVSAPAARMFRLLGVHPGPDITVQAAASLAAVSAPTAREALTELERAHMLTQHMPGRYAFHDLLRSYALERASSDDQKPARRAAVRRALDHYLHTAHAAALALNPARTPITLAAARSGVKPEVMAGQEQAMTWFAAEHQVLIAAAKLAASDGHDAHVWQLAWSLTEFLDRGGYWHEWAELWQAGLEAAERLDDRSAHARAAQSLGRVYIRLAWYEDARVHLQRSLDLYATISDPIGQTHAHLNMAWLCDRLGHPGEALMHARSAQGLCHTAGDQHGEADCCNAVGWYSIQVGDPQSAIVACRQAVALLHQFNDVLGEAMAWDSLGYAHHQLTQYDDAVTCYEHAILLRERIGDRYNRAATLVRLGDTHHAHGHDPPANSVWRQALTVLDDLRHPDAEQVRAKIAQASPTRR